MIYRYDTIYNDITLLHVPLSIERLDTRLCILYIIGYVMNYTCLREYTAHVRLSANDY